MSTSKRKGNWNEIAGTLKHRLTRPTDKDLKKGEEKEELGRAKQKPGKTQSEPHKPISKIERPEK
jgi:hypothetical protein